METLRRIFFKRPMFFRLLLAFLAFILLTFLVSLGFYIQEAVTAEKTQDIYLYQTLSAKVQSFQYMLDRATADTQVFSTTEEAARLSQADSPAALAAMEKDIDGLKDFMATYARSRMAFDQVSYFFEESDTLAGVDKNLYLITGRQEICRRLDLSESAWDLLLSQNTALLTRGTDSDKNLLLSTRISDRCVVIRRVPNTSLRSNFFMILPEDSALEDFLPFWQVSVIDQCGNLVTWDTPHHEAFISPENALWAANKGTSAGVIPVNSNGQKYNCLSLKMDNFSLKILLFRPNTMTPRIWKYIFRCFLGCILPLFIVGGLLAYFFSRRLYSPIEQTIQQLPPQMRNTEEAEHLKISRAISVLTSQNERLKKIHTQQDSQLKKAFIQSLLAGNVPLEASMETLLARYHIQELFDCYLVFLFQVDSYKDTEIAKSGDAQQSWDSEQTISLIQEQIIDTIPLGLEVHFIPFGFEVVGLLSNHGQTIWEPFEHLKNFQNNLQQNDIVISIFYSAVHTDALEAEQAYQEAVRVSEHAASLGKSGTILGTEAICSPVKTASLPYQELLRKEQRLAILLEEKEYRDGKIVFDKILEEILSSQAPFSQMRSAVIGLLDMSVAILPDELVTEESQKVLLALHSTKKESDLAKVSQRFWESCVPIDGTEQKKTYSQRFEGIQKYIMEHYRDDNLSAQKVADAFGISMSSLSREIKNNTGVAFSDYLHQLRIRQAKQELRETDLPLRIIAANVGYSNDLTMMRAFKRYEGMTPSEYRNGTHT